MSECQFIEKSSAKLQEGSERFSWNVSCCRLGGYERRRKTTPVMYRRMQHDDDADDDYEEEENYQ
jgi:hypothetical protein